MEHILCIYDYFACALPPGILFLFWEKKNSGNLSTIQEDISKDSSLGLVLGLTDYQNCYFCD